MGKIKSLIKSSRIYNGFKFWKDIFIKDIFDLEKMWLFWKVYPYTMSGYRRLSNVYELSKKIEIEKINGVFVECGVWRGGCAAVMAYVAKKARSGRKIWLFDSFKGLPEPTKEDGLIAKDYANNKTEGKLETIEKCVGTLDEVKEVFFEVLGINSENVVIQKGWFQDTLPRAKEKIGGIAILRLDGDWYESTKCCLENLYENVIVGGYVIIDDYGHWEGAKKALDEFFANRNIKAELIKIDYTGAYFKKP
jgi:hypothetical protein